MGAGASHGHRPWPEYFKQVIKLMESGEHLTQDGLSRLLDIPPPTAWAGELAAPLVARPIRNKMNKRD